MKKNSVIWIIDDDPGILEAVKMILEEENYETKMLSDEKMLDQELKKGVPTLILLDILLSGIDGRDIAYKIKQNPEMKHVPIIMMSADTHIEEKAKEAGVNDFIRKPFDISELIEKIEHHIQQKAL